MSHDRPSVEDLLNPSLADAQINAVVLCHFVAANPDVLARFRVYIEHHPGDLDDPLVLAWLAATHDKLAPDCPYPVTDPVPKSVPLTDAERRVWAAWGELPEGHPSPVKQIARDLNMTPADVAFIVYPADQFGPWADDQEPDL